MDQLLQNGEACEATEENEPSEAATTATASSSDSNNDFAGDSIGKYCGNCNKLEKDPEHAPLKECNKCHSILYCSRDCQKADFKKHKKTCASLAQTHAQTSGPSRMQVTRAPPKTGGGARGLQKWQFDT
ncbi:hypothetical protein LTR85_011788 [Meristemomyces frigidus]|nr:hypothetical protein LTR85_011788 [Meristemomyces frigidus]